MSKATDGTHPDIPSKDWENPFVPGNPLHDLFDQVLSQNRDLIVLVDDYHARRGTGKTIASLQLANGMDQTDEGLTSEKVSLQPEEVREAYVQQPKRSGLVLDEAEVGASNRQAMSKVNQALREIMSMGRVKQKYVVVNAPAKDMIDKDIRMLADVWVSMTRKGEGLVHFLEREPYAGTLLTPKKQYIEFADIPTDSPLRSIYNELTREKKQRIRGDEGEGYVPRSEVQDRIGTAEEEAKREKRNEIIKALYHEDVADLSQAQIGELGPIDLDQAQISNIINDR